MISVKPSDEKTPSMSKDIWDIEENLGFGRVQRATKFRDK
jgi:hypothetical protein